MVFNRTVWWRRLMIHFKAGLEMLGINIWPGLSVTPPAGRRSSLAEDEPAVSDSEQGKKDAPPTPQSLSQHLIAAQEMERRRIARELHDELGQALTALKINLDIAGRALPAESSPQLRRSLDEARSLPIQTLEAARNLALDLRPAMLDDLGLEAALRWAVDRYEGRTGLATYLQVDLPQRRLAPTLELTLYRIINEALTNVARHAQAQTVWITLALRKKEVLARVQDDGLGFELQARDVVAPQSLGLISMRERAALLNGTFQIISKPGRGTTVEVCFPLAPD